jgi:predicted O-linked N-acetylglucosamine transferase (SPINDLY family)
MKAKDVLPQARELYEAGDFEGAAQACRRLLKSQPRETEALYLLGVIAHQTGNQPFAVECMRRALALAPDHGDCWNILGLALTILGNDDEAGASFERAIALGDSPHFCNNLGSLRKKQGRFDDAMAAYRRVLTQNPDFADAYFNLGSIYREKQEWDAAAECFQKAVRANPTDVEAWANLGQVLRILQRSEEAVQVFERALAFVPDNAELHCDLGDALRDLNQTAKAITEYTFAGHLNPNLARAWFSAGVLHNLQEEYAAALEYFEKALEIEPQWPAAQHDLGKALFNLGQVDEALHCFEKAVAGDHPELPLSMIALIIPGSPQAGNQDILDARRTYAKYLPCPQPTERDVQRQPLNRKVHGGRPLRVGYVSSFFQFPNWMKPVWALMNHHDRGRFEVHLFSDAAASAVTHGYRPHPDDRFHDISGLSNEAAAECVVRAGIDVLVDLNGYSKMSRLGLFALRSAPVQAGWFNMYATTGVSTYDYLIGDAVVIPPEEEKFYSEKILRVPGSYLTFEVGYPVPDVSDSPYREHGFVTFGCLASQYKVTREVVAAWSRILHRAPHSRLILKNAMMGSPGTQRYVRRLFDEEGVSPDRVRLEGPSDHYQFLKTYDEIDVALDTFPYNGGTTTTEAIWQGVPVITFWGDRWVARTSATILHAAKLGQFVARGVDDYVAKAVELATSASAAADLAERRGNMRTLIRDSPACDARSFARNIETLYTEI